MAKLKLHLLISLFLTLTHLLNAQAGLKNDEFDYVIYSIYYDGGPISDYAFKKINASEVAQIAPAEVASKINATNGVELYLLRAPTQNTAGYVFEGVKSDGKVSFCLKKPSQDLTVLMTLSNPAAIVKVKKGTKISLSKNYCNHLAP